MDKTPTIKVAVIGPQRVGKSVVANTLAGFSNVVSKDYRPTAGCRILECEKKFSEENMKTISYIKNNDLKSCKINLWDTSGDRK